MNSPREISVLCIAKPEVPVIMLVKEKAILAPGATNQADAVLTKAEETGRPVSIVRGLAHR